MRFGGEDDEDEFDEEQEEDEVSKGLVDAQSGCRGHAISRPRKGDPWTCR